MKIIFKWILFKMSERVFYISGHLLLKFRNCIPIWNIDPEFVQMACPALTLMLTHWHLKVLSYRMQRPS